MIERVQYGSDQSCGLDDLTPTVVVLVAGHSERDTRLAQRSQDDLEPMHAAKQNTDVSPFDSLALVKGYQVFGEGSGF